MVQTNDAQLVSNVDYSHRLCSIRNLLDRCIDVLVTIVDRSAQWKRMRCRWQTESHKSRILYVTRVRRTGGKERKRRISSSPSHTVSATEGKETMETTLTLFSLSFAFPDL